MRLLLARHANAEYVEAFFSDEGGWLGPSGRRQAAALADQIHEFEVEQIWCSDVARAVQTAEIVGTELGVESDPPVITRKGLREVHIGELLGQPFDVTRIDAVVDAWFATHPSADPATGLDAAFPGGESGHDVLRRQLAVLDEIAASDAETVLLVGHQMALAALLGELTGLATKLDNCEVVEFDLAALSRPGRS